MKKWVGEPTLNILRNYYILSLKSPNLKHTGWTYVHAGKRGLLSICVQVFGDTEVQIAQSPLFYCIIFAFGDWGKTKIYTMNKSPG